jgi:antitoxin component YwqK of YwqJK toxin-antitoxin module
MGDVMDYNLFIDDDLNLKTVITANMWTGPLPNGVLHCYENGMLKMIIEYVDGIAHGLYILIYKSKVSTTGRYENGLKNGVWHYFHDSGHIRESIVFKKDKEQLFD